MNTVSVIIPAYNHAHVITEALESVFRQTWRDFEIIVINDGSTDNTAEVLAPFIAAGNIRYFEQSNRGQGAARNRGLAEANGKYIAYLDDDDLWLEDKLAWQVTFLEQNPKAVLVYGDHVEFDATGYESIYKTIGKPSGDVRRDFLLRNWIHSPGQTLIRASALNHVRGFDPEIWGSDDWELYIRLSNLGYFLHETRLCLRYRLHPGNASRSAIRHARNHFCVMRKHYPLNPVVALRHLRCAGDYFVPNLLACARTARSNGDFATALSAQMHALCFQPEIAFRRDVAASAIANLLRIPPRKRLVYKS